MIAGRERREAGGKSNGRRLPLRLAAALVSTTGCPGMMTRTTTLQTPHGEVRAILGESDDFPRFVVPDQATLVAQSELEPYAVVYCVVRDVAVGMTPTLDGLLLHLSAGGLSDGVVLVRDDETGTFWDITGRALAGPLARRQLDTWPIERTSAVAAIVYEPTLLLARSEPGPYGALWSRFVTGVTRDEDGFIPPYFRRTMGDADSRRQETELGLGVVVGGVARFYPAGELAQNGASVRYDAIGATELTISPVADAKTYVAAQADGSRPFQVWGRWYGFSATFRDCGVYSASAVRVGTPVEQPALAQADGPRPGDR